MQKNAGVKMNEIKQKEGKIKYISKSDRNNSFCLEEDKKVWYALRTKNDDFIEDLANSGDEVKFFYTDEDNRKIVETLNVLKSASANKKDWSEDLVNFEALLNKAHEITNGKFTIKTKLLHIDWEKKIALFKAIIKTEKGIFIGHGDTTMENIPNKNIQPHFLRQAETRAIVRALRFMTNIAKTAKEEIE